jgi:flagellar basal body-associated protein FliL
LWHLDLLSKPSDKIPIVLLVDGLFLLVLGLGIIVLHLGEKAEDKKENESISAFNYL